MNRDVKFWVSMAIFQICFGLAVFAVTRAHYMQPAAEVSAPQASASHSELQSAAPAQPLTSLGPGGLTQFVQSGTGQSASSAASTQDPVELSRLASQAFASQQYDSALSYYQRLAALEPNSVDVINEIGLTLHYLGRSSEAVQKLKEGIAKDPAHQRIRLTLGYVYAQMGNFKDARAALTAASQIGNDPGIKQSALDMLNKLPQ
jgi:Flp pilus assembly protein TadD